MEVVFWSKAIQRGMLLAMDEVNRAGGVLGRPLALVTRDVQNDPPAGVAALQELRAYLIEIVADLHASEYPLDFGDTKEGSMGIRIKDAVRVDRKKGGTLTNAEGKHDQKGCWGRVSDWCDYSGPIGDKTAGLTVFADPKNAIDSAWHARDYGLLAANPFGREKHAQFPDRKGKTETVKLKKGEHLKLRYGLYLHAGDVKEGKVKEAFEAFTGK